MNLYQPTISGSLTVSGSVEIIGPFTMSGGSISGTASFAQNAGFLSSLDSSSFVGTGSFNSMSSSVSTRVTKIEGNYATTGSNIFLGAQTVCANITSTGTIVAQTLNVQQVTSSVVYSSGSNVFGCDLSNVQQFTGSVNITGSLSNTGCTILNNPVLIKYPNTDVNAIQICATTGTNASAMVFSNSGGNFYVGKDNSTGGRIVLSAVPYANAIWAENCCAISFGVGNVERLRINCSDIINIGSITSTNNKTIQFQVDTSLSYSGRIQMSNDTSILYLNGGGNLGYNFGASIELVGKDRYSCCHGGQLTLRAGNSENNAGFGYIAFETCNTERMRITRCGFVGIGTCTPSVLLDVNKCSATNINIISTNLYQNQGNLIQFCQNTTGGTVVGYIGHAGDSTGDLTIFNGATKRVAISSTGVACFACQVCAPTFNAVGVSRFFNAIDTSTTNYRYMEIANAGASMYYGVERSTAAGLIYNSDPYSTVWATTNATNLNFGTNLYKRLTIDCTGIAIFTCQVCLPASNTSLVAGTYGTLSNVGGIDTNIGNNAYYDGTNWRRFAAQEAARIYINRDGFTFLRKASDGAGSTISWDNTLFLAGSGVACFTCQVCAPNFITTGTNASVRGGDPAFFRGTTVTQSGNSVTFDAFRFLNPTGGVGGAASSISGRLYMSFHDTSTGGNQVSYQYLIITTGNGVSPGPYCFVQLYCGPVRGTNPISAISLVNDGAGGAVKVQATTAASGVAGAVAYITFIGTAV